ncbi:hypothetical protein K438DRAFT_1992660 [Mycena galopus ATCC 62051]|nr:hypothetical protein K438DRAFT_1992660 [Mycena galopus ATCC 62051]
MAGSTQTYLRELAGCGVATLFNQASLTMYLVIDAQLSLAKAEPYHYISLRNPASSSPTHFYLFASFLILGVGPEFSRRLNKIQGRQISNPDRLQRPLVDHPTIWLIFDLNLLDHTSLWLGVLRVACPTTTSSTSLECMIMLAVAGSSSIPKDRLDDQATGTWRGGERCPCNRWRTTPYPGPRTSFYWEAGFHRRRTVRTYTQTTWACTRTRGATPAPAPTRTLVSPLSLGPRTRSCSHSPALGQTAYSMVTLARGVERSCAGRGLEAPMGGGRGIRSSAAWCRLRVRFTSLLAHVVLPPRSWTLTLTLPADSKTTGFSATATYIITTSSTSVEPTIALAASRFRRIVRVLILRNVHDPNEIPPEAPAGLGLGLGQENRDKINMTAGEFDVSRAVHEHDADDTERTISVLRPQLVHVAERHCPQAMRTTSIDPVASLKPTNIPNDDCDLPRGYVSRRREAHLCCTSPSSPCPAPLSTSRRPSLRSVFSAGVSVGGVLAKLSAIKHRMVVEAGGLEEWHEERYGVQGRVALGRRVVPLAKAAPRQHTLQLSSLVFLPEHGSTPARPRAELLARTRTDDAAPPRGPVLGIAPTPHPHDLKRAEPLSSSFPRRRHPRTTTSARARTLSTSESHALHPHPEPYLLLHSLLLLHPAFHPRTICSPSAHDVLATRPLTLAG